jgi:histidyl-tRNA synthetase
MALSTQPYKGTRDFYPDEMRHRRWMLGRLRKAVESFGYEEYDGPMLEPFDLYAAKTGEEIVNQQLYWLIDRGERKLAIRPEMTPTLARMVAAKINELPRPIRWYSIPNLWRYERPQRGRLREHWQLNVDVLGGDPIDADAEILTLALELMARFKAEKLVTIRVNNRRLMDHFFEQELKLPTDVALKTTKAIDARSKVGEEAYAKWLGELGITAAQRDRMERFFHEPFEKTAQALPCEGVEELKKLFAILKEGGYGEQIVFDPAVLRGLDYYTGTVFEMYDTSPENRRAMFGGGRYDNLVGLFGNYKLSGVGLGMGDVTLWNFLETHKLLEPQGSGVDVFVSLPKSDLRGLAMKLARECRDKGLRAVSPLSIEGFGAQLKQASKLGARYAVLFGDKELAAGQVLVKDLAKGEQTPVNKDQVAHWLASRVNVIG